MKDQNNYRRFIDESTDSNNKESVNSVFGSSEGFDIFDEIIAEKESKKATVDVTNSLQKDSATKITDDQNPFRCGMSRVEAVDNGKNPSNYYPPRGFVLGESRATMEIIPVDGSDGFGSTPTQHATVQNATESVSESRTGESEESVQTQQPASPTQIPLRPINPFATNSSDPSLVTQPVLPVQQQNSPIVTGAVNTGSEVKTEIVPEEDKQIKSENIAVKNKSEKKDILIEIVKKQNLFIDQFKKPHVTIDEGLCSNDVSIESEAFKQFLILEAVDHGYLIDSKLKGATTYAKALAMKSQNEIPIHLRFNFDGNQLVYDLNDGMDRIVHADKDGWNVVQKGIRKFHRPSYLEAMLIPDRGGDVLDILDYLNINNHYEKVIVVIWMIAALATDIDRPILMIEGSQGSGKTTAANIIRGSIDPVKLSGLGMPTKIRDFDVSLKNHQVPSYDNLTSISGDIQDLLCRVVTGGGDERCKLYTDDESYAVSFKRSVILTGISNPITHNDLLDRTVAIKLSRRESSYKSKVDLMNAFEQKKSSIFGGILNIFVKALALHDDVKKELKNLPRMSDFFTLGAAIAEAIGEERGFGKNMFVEAYTYSMRTVHKAKVTDDPVLSVLTGFLDSCVQQNPDLDSYEFQMSDLLAKVRNYAKDNTDTEPEELPTKANDFSRKLKSVIPVLEHMGWNLSERKMNGCKYVKFRKSKKIG